MPTPRTVSPRRYVAAPIAVLVALVAFGPRGALAAGPGDAAPPKGEAAFLENVRQLTFDGRRAGEGYFDRDGDRLVFQSEREPGNPFYQIYELDLTAGDTRRVSNGVGKTTCAFYLGGSGAILYSSTHHDPRSATLQREELEFRASGRERRYAWDYDPQMEIYVALPGGDLVRLTRAPGYDAEASSSPDGKWIVFASNRHVFAEPELDDATRERLEIDPAYFNELYRMRADGSDVQRLTTTAGYDGGPFYTADGERIVWRRFDEEGLIADIWSMAADGSDPRRLTDFGAMSWAPYPHPSGEYVLFTSNKHGFSNFELFVVDADGEKQPVRVTTTDGFDGLPVPSPDGRTLVWTSSRRSGDRDGAQLFIGRWNHEHALAALRAAPRREP